jgi:hypothetical protein
MKLLMSKHFYFAAKNKNIALLASLNPRRKKNIHKYSSPYRWIVEQALGILSWNRSLKICWSKLIESSLGLLQLACSIRVFKMAGIFV